MKTLKSILICFFTVCSFNLIAQEYIKDNVGFLKGEEFAKLEQKLKDFEEQTSNEIAIHLVKSLNEKTVEEYANDLFNELGIGKKGKDNGILILCAKEERKIRIEVGYGLEHLVTDVVAKHIIENNITSWFKSEKYFYGLNYAIDNLIRVITETKVEVSEKFINSDNFISEIDFLKAKDLKRIKQKLKKHNSNKNNIPIVIRVSNYEQETGGFKHLFYAKNLRERLQNDIYPNQKFCLLYLNVNKNEKNGKYFAKSVIALDSLTNQVMQEKSISKYYSKEYDLVNLPMNGLLHQLNYDVIIASFNRNKIAQIFDEVFLFLPRLLQGEVPSDMSIIDEKYNVQDLLMYDAKAKILSQEEEGKLRGKLKNYHKETGNPIYVRVITEYIYEDAYVYRLLNELKKEISSDARPTLIFIRVNEGNDKDDSKYFSGMIKVVTDWRDDKFTQAGSVLKSNVLNDYFDDKQYTKGFNKTIKFIKKLQQGSIEVEDIKPADSYKIDWDFWSIILFSLGLPVVITIIVLVFGPKGRGGGSVSYGSGGYSSWSSSSSNTSYSSGSSYDGRGGSGSFGGGSSGGGGASGDW